MPADRPQTVPRKPTARARTTNGSALVVGDNRSVWVRRARDVMAEYVVDLGGSDAVSTAELSIIRRIATLTVELEQLEAKFASDGEASARALDLYTRGAGHLGRLVKMIGTKRRIKTIASLDDYLAAKGKAAR